IDFVPCHTFNDVFEKVSHKEVQYGIIPIENSFTGQVYQNFDLLLEHDLWITGETQVRVVHNLIAHPGAAFDEIKKVYSHPQGLGQCQKFLLEHPHIEQVPAYDTAGSVQIIKEEGLRDAAAIASRNAAEFYGMNILKEEIEDIKQNYTRFLVLNKDRIIPERADKTSIVYTLKNVPGILFRSLSVFALRDIGLSKIESRPLHGKPWQYYFYLDIEDCIENERCINAINHLKEITDFLKILGSYEHGLEE
ncbi:prephenate dehydratase, partial [candidate division KSB1 bacterium]